MNRLLILLAACAPFAAAAQPVYRWTDAWTGKSGVIPAAAPWFP